MLLVNRLYNESGRMIEVGWGGISVLLCLGYLTDKGYHGASALPELLVVVAEEIDEVLLLIYANMLALTTTTGDLDDTHKRSSSQRTYTIQPQTPPNRPYSPPATACQPTTKRTQNNSDV